MGINSCGRSKHWDCSLFWPLLSQGGKINDTQLLLEQNIWQAWLLVFLPTKLSVLLIIIFFISLKITKITSKKSNFWGMWPLGHVGHMTYSFINVLFISAGISDDNLLPQILSVGTTANSPFRITFYWGQHYIKMWHGKDKILWRTIT